MFPLVACGPEATAYPVRNDPGDKPLKLLSTTCNVLYQHRQLLVTTNVTDVGVNF